MDANIIKALSVALLLIGGFAYAGFLVYLGAKLHDLEMRLDALEEEVEAQDER